MLKGIISLLFFLYLSPLLLAQEAQEIPPPEYIRTVQFRGTSTQNQIPIIKLGERLQISFDALNGEEEDFYYKIDHYNFDWTPSDLSKNEYLGGFDEVRIETYENSLNTLQIFSHYYLTIPNRETSRISKSGNYLITFSDDDGNVVFSRKFIVMENIVGVQVEIKRARDLKRIRTDQVVQFTINSPSLLLINPKRNVKTLVMQNSNIKTAITDLTPQYNIGTELIYRYDKEASFGGGNEYHNFDNKDVRAANNSIRRIELNDIYENFLFTDIDRSDRPYTYNPDINGDFVVRNLNAQNQNIEAEYVRLHFNLQYFEPLGDKEIHIYGNFNNYTIDGSTYMRYNKVTDSYQNARLFKQGFYNYKYVLVDRDGSIDEGAISGDFWETENNYTVIVYYRGPGDRYDRVIGIGSGSSTNITNN
jgi:Type 9 secretion system plug protein 1st domain